MGGGVPSWVHGGGGVGVVTVRVGVGHGDGVTLSGQRCGGGHGVRPSWASSASCFAHFESPASCFAAQGFRLRRSPSRPTASGSRASGGHSDGGHE